MTGTTAPVRARCLIVTRDRFPPSRVDVAVLFGEELAARGYRMDWILPAGAPCGRAFVGAWKGGWAWVAANGCGVSVWARLHDHLRFTVNELRLFRLLFRRTYDLVLVKDRFLIAVLAAFTCRVLAKPMAFWQSFPYAEEAASAAASQTGLRRATLRIKAALLNFVLYRMICRWSGHSFVQSDLMKRHFLARGVAADRLTVVPMGVAPDLLDRRCTGKRTERAGGLQSPTAVYVGSLSRLRRMEFLVDVWESVVQQVPGAQLRIVGGSMDPTDEPNLKNHIDRRMLSESVVLTGHLDHREALRLAAEADVCLSYMARDPALDFASPTKLIEYMALGKAVVASDQPEQQRVIADSGAGRCVANEIDAFADAIVALLGDPVRAAAMGARGRAYAAQHRRYDRIADLVDGTLTAMLERRHGSYGPVLTPGE